MRGDLRGVVRLKKQGKTLDEVINAKPTAGYDAKCVALSPVRHSFTRLVHAGL